MVPSQMISSTGSTTNRLAYITGGLLVAVYLLLNLYGIGGTDFIINVNNNLSNLLALGVMILAVLLWRQFSAGSQNRTLFTGLAIGWTLWLIAEIWWAVAVLLGQEMPYPSWADFFWLVGYIPMYAALLIRIQSLPKKIGSRQLSIILFASLVIIAATVIFVLIPILQANDPTRLLESILNVLYPVVDLVLLIMVLLIFFSYQRGRYGLAWIWLSVGFILHSLSNLIFSYAVGMDLYYPENALNLISTIGIDVPYTLSYLLWLIGLYLIYKMHGKYQPYLEAEPSFTLVPNTHISISTKNDGTIIDVSRNYTSLFLDEKVQGKTLHQVIGLVDSTAHSILSAIEEKNVLSERPVQIVTPYGSQDAQISGIAVINPQQDYAGAMLLLRLFAPEDGADELMTDHQKGVFRSLAARTGVKAARETEILSLLDSYYSTYFKALYNHVLTDGGAVMADALAASLQDAAQSNGWQIDYQPNNFLSICPRSASEAQNIYPAVLETIKKYIASIFDGETVSAIVRKVDARIDPLVHRNVAYLNQSKL